MNISYKPVAVKTVHYKQRYLPLVKKKIKNLSHSRVLMKASTNSDLSLQHTFKKNRH